jgi:RNA polymerase sigma factor (sigma-70 family)
VTRVIEDDFTLLEAWSAGDQIAGNRLVRRHFSAVFRFFRTKVPDDLAEDLTQQTLLGLVKGRDRLRRDSAFKAYLFAIARRQLLFSLRSRYRADKVFAPEHVSVQELAVLSASAGTVAVAQFEQRLLLAALRAIPVDFQIVVELHYWEGMTIEEIAHAMEVAPGTVKSRLSRARAMLQARIDELTANGSVSAPTGGLDRWVSSLREELDARKKQDPR